MLALAAVEQLLLQQLPRILQAYLLGGPHRGAALSNVVKGHLLRVGGVDRQAVAGARLARVGGWVGEWVGVQAGQANTRVKGWQ